MEPVLPEISSLSLTDQQGSNSDNSIPTELTAPNEVKEPIVVQEDSATKVVDMNNEVMEPVQEDQKSEVTTVDNDTVHEPTVVKEDSKVTTVENEVKVEPAADSKTTVEDNDVKEEPSVVQESNNVVDEDKDNAGNKYFMDILTQYLHAVGHREKHAAFLKDSVVGPFLTLSLGSKSTEVVLKAMEVIDILMENTQNHIRLQQLLHFLDALNDVARNEQLPLKTRVSAARMYELVKDAKVPLGPSLNLSNSSNNPGDSHHHHKSHGTATSAHHSKDFEKYKSLKKQKSVARVTVLCVPSVVLKERRTLITNALVKVEGIISVTYNITRQHCIIRAKPHVQPSILGTTIANLGFECSLVTKNENNVDVLIPVKADNFLEMSSHLEKENVPQYFPEEEDKVSDNAVAKFGDEKGSGQTGGWWNSASKLIKKSLYW